VGKIPPSPQKVPEALPSTVDNRASGIFYGSPQQPEKARQIYPEEGGSAYNFCVKQNNAPTINY
jgi:hypothetical protein